MKIGIDCRLWDETGVGRYIRNLVNELQILDKKNNYVLFVRSKDHENIRFAIRNSQFAIRAADIKWHTLKEQLKFPSLINKENLDLMHFPYISVPIFYNKPFVVTIHDLIPLHFPTGEASTLSMPLYKIKLLGYKFVLSAAAKKAKRIITVSNATKTEIADHLKVSEDKIIVTYEGIDDKITNSKSQIPNKSQNTKYRILDAKYFLYIGNAYPHKNLERLIDAFEILRGACIELVECAQNDIKLVLVGKEDYFYKRLKEKVKEMGLQKYVLFYGEVNDEELGNLYKNAIALVNPSLMEGFGLPALEAMANGCLVLASNIPALKEVCGESAIYFDPYDVNDIVRKMKEVYYDNMYHHRDKIKKGLERSKKFSWEKMAIETLKIYEKCYSASSE